MDRVVIFEPDAWDDFSDWLTRDLKVARRIIELLKETRRSPFAGKYKPYVKKVKSKRLQGLVQYG